MRQVGREFEREQHVVKLQMLADVLAKRRVSGQLEQATMVFGQFEFAGRTQHALAFNAAQFADFDDEGFSVFARRQFSAH